MRYRFLWFGLLACFLSLSLFSCASIVSHNSRTAYGSGRSVPGYDTLRQIRPGETTRVWVVETLGTPTSRTQLDDGAEILRYEYVRETRNKVGCLFIIDIDHSTVSEENLYFEIRDGIVERYWRD